MGDVPLWLLIVLPLVACIFDAILAYLEATIDSFNENRVKKLAEDGDKDAMRMLRIKHLPTKLFASVRFTAAFINMLAGAVFVYGIACSWRSAIINSSLAEYISGELLFWVLTILLIFAAAFVRTLFCELLPRRIALIKEEKAERGAADSAFNLFCIVRPVVYLLVSLSNLFARPFGVPQDANGDEVTEDEILMMVDAGEESGAIESNEKEMIENVFDFSSTTAEEVMTHRTNICAICIDDSDKEIVDLIKETGKTRFPVYGEDLDHIEGLLIARDFLLNLNSENPKPLAQLLRQAYFVPESVRLNVLFKDMQRENTHMAIVVDEYGGTAGLVTMEDLLEELVGNIYDEYDKAAEQDILQIGENEWRVAGSLDMETLAEHLKIDIPEEDFDTVGGLVFSQLSTIPPDGSTPEVVVDGLWIKVEELKDKRVVWARVSQIMTVEPESSPEEEE